MCPSCAWAVRWCLISERVRDRDAEIPRVHRPGRGTENVPVVDAGHLDLADRVHSRAPGYDSRGALTANRSRRRSECSFGTSETRSETSTNA